jgi:hypothetical protein
MGLREASFILKSRHYISHAHKLFLIPFPLLKQPLHPIHRIHQLLLAESRRRVEGPEPMRQTGIDIHPSLDAPFFAQNLLVEEPFITQQVHAADLEVCWR